MVIAAIVALVTWRDHPMFLLSFHRIIPTYMSTGISINRHMYMPTSYMINTDDLHDSDNIMVGVGGILDSTSADCHIAYL